MQRYLNPELVGNGLKVSYSERGCKEKNMVEVQSIILNLAFPKSLEELLDLHKTEGRLNIETLIDSMSNDEIISWSVSKWIKPGDIVFFMHSKSSIHTIIRLKNQLKKNAEQFDKKESIIRALLSRGENIYNKYGGKIFAIGRVADNPVYIEPYELDYNPHWKSRIYADVEDCVLLDHPIELSEFNSFIKLSCGGSITPVYGKEYEKLKATVAAKNHIPRYLVESIATPMPLSGINSENWIQITQKYRRQFIYESQFRSYYVDYLLKDLGDRRSFYSECACKKASYRTSFIDNVILFEKTICQ